MNHNETSIPVLEPGSVAQFMYLHLDTASWKAKHPLKEHHHLYEIDGKERPVLVYDGPWKANGISWYRVFPITSKGRDTNGSIKKRHVDIGQIIDRETNSYIKRDLESYPENLLRRKRESLHPAVLAGLLKNIGFEGLQSGKDQK